ncbi:hypothetical protein AKJ16_DCAP04690 [Drosera capensis]
MAGLEAATNEGVDPDLQARMVEIWRREWWIVEISRHEWWRREAPCVKCCSRVKFSIGIVARYGEHRRLKAGAIVLSPLNTVAGSGASDVVEASKAAGVRARGYASDEFRTGNEWKCDRICTIWNFGGIGRAE